jgi:hypothetical protein
MKDLVRAEIRDAVEKASSHRLRGEGGRRSMRHRPSNRHEPQLSPSPAARDG